MPLTPYRFPSLSIVIISTLFWTSLTSIVSSTPLASTVSEREITSSDDHQSFLVRDRQLAQLFYPKPSESQTIQVIGIGEASRSADRAAFTLHFTPKEDNSALPGMATPLTFADLEPIITALKAEGISVLETKISPGNSQALPFPIPGNSDSGGAAIVISIENPQSEDLDQVMQVVRAAEKQGDQISLKTAKVQFELDNCTALEQETYQAAVNNAQNRAQAIAKSIGATLDIPAVSEPFYSLALPGCSLRTLSFLNQPQTYKTGMETDVQITRQLFFTYPITKTLQ